MDSKLKVIKELFEEIKESDKSEDVKAIQYAELMTRLEKIYKLPMLDIQEKISSSDVNSPALKLYKEIARERVI